MCIMNGRKRQRRRRTGSGDVVHVLIMYHVSQAMSFIVVGTRALGRSRHRLVLDTRRNDIHIGDDSDTVEGLGLNDIAIVPFWCSVQLALIHENGQYLRFYGKLFYSTILDTYKAINGSYRASIACYPAFFGVFLGCFSVTLAPVFDLYLACPFLSSLATGMRFFDI